MPASIPLNSPTDSSNRSRKEASQPPGENAVLLSFPADGTRTATSSEDAVREAARKLEARGVHDPHATLRYCAAAVVDRACEVFDEGGKTSAWLDVVVQDGGSRLRARRESASDLLRELAVAEAADQAREARL